MPSWWQCGVKTLMGFTCLSLSFLATPVGAQSWRSPILGHELVVVEKTVHGDLSAPRSLPPAVREKLGADFVEYESFIAARLPAGAAKALTAAALAEKRGVFRDTRPPAMLPFQSFRPEDIEERWARWRGRGLPPMPVPDLFLIRFAFPLLDEWTEALRACGADPILYYGNEMFLTRARNLGVIQSCQPAARYLAWADAFRVTDRTSPELLDTADLDFRPWSLVFVPGTDLDTALAELPAAMETGGHMTWEDGALSLGVRAGRPELEDLARTSLHLMSILEAEGEPQPSDERQGQILAGNYAGYPAAASGAVTTPGYLSWLAGRGLSTGTNLQTAAVFDTGFDNSDDPQKPRHPDLIGRLHPVESLACFVFNRTLPIDDTRGHGTVVTGIIVSDGTAGPQDAQGFRLALGVAPTVRVVPIQVIDSESNCSQRTGFGDPPDNLSNAIAFGRVTSTGVEKAPIANHSWNLGTTLNIYSSMAKLFDERTIDGAPSTAGAQPTIMVVSAGNNGPGKNTVLSPATAKNILAVGSTQNYRPSTEPGAPPNTCSLITDSRFTQEANNIGKVSAFSSRGADFRPYNLPVVPPQLTETRIKPDIAGPGERIFSTVPFQSTTYTCPGGLCHQNWPVGTAYSFGSGTSFAAPAVTGVVAHVRKWFMDRGVLNPPPSPSLIKAALVATATDLGSVMGSDHRPSNAYGWGRVDLNALTNPLVARFYVNERVEFAVTTGAEIDWQRTVDDPGKPTYIVLAWSDPASSVGATSQIPLVNDLRLTVEMVGANVYYRGNNFYENIDGNDNGYSYPYALGGAPLINDTMNNVEGIFIPVNTFWPGQKIIIRVTGVSIHGAAQKFALYGYNVRFGS